MKKLFCIFMCAAFFIFGLQSVFCQQADLVEFVCTADADRVELIPEVSFELPAQPLRIIEDAAQINELNGILRKAVCRQPCDCLPEYVLCFYKNDVLLAKISFGVAAPFLRYQQQDYELPQGLLTFLEL